MQIPLFPENTAGEKVQVIWKKLKEEKLKIPIQDILQKMTFWLLIKGKAKLETLLLEYKQWNLGPIWVNSKIPNDISSASI